MRHAVNKFGYRQAASTPLFGDQAAAGGAFNFGKGSLVITAIRGGDRTGSRSRAVDTSLIVRGKAARTSVTALLSSS